MCKKVAKRENRVVVAVVAETGEKLEELGHPFKSLALAVTFSPRLAQAHKKRHDQLGYFCGKERVFPERVKQTLVLW